MTKQLDPKYSRQLQSGLQVIYWSKRCFYEVVEELSEAAFRIWITVGLAYYIESTTRLGGWRYWLAIGIICVLLSQKAIYEVTAWTGEVYVVCRDTVNGNGRVYKFYLTKSKGWFKEHGINEYITPGSPACPYDQDWPYSVWGFITGENMERINLRSVTNTFIEGRKISPKLRQAIDMVRGKPSAKRDVNVSDLNLLSDVKQAAVDGLISWSKAKQAAETLLVRTVWGE